MQQCAVENHMRERHNNQRAHRPQVPASQCHAPNAEACAKQLPTEHHLGDDQAQGYRREHKPRLVHAKQHGCRQRHSGRRMDQRQRKDDKAKDDVRSELSRK